MNGQDWLNYWQAQAAGDGEKRKADWLDAVTGALGAGVGLMATGGNPAGAMAGWGIGKSVGSVGENAVNHTLTPGNVMGDAMGGIGAYSGYQNGMTPISPQGGGTQPDLPMPMPGGGPGEDLLARLLGQYPMMGFAEGGEVQPQQPQGPVIRSSQDVADFMKGLEEAINGMPGSTYTPERVNHPTLEMLASVVPDVVKALPAPRQTNSVNKTVGAWLPAAATTFSAPINYGKAQREERNKRGSEAAKALAEHRWSVAKSMVDSLDTMKSLTGSGGSADQLTPEQYDAMGVPPQFRTSAGYKAWLGNRARSDQNVGRLALAARTNKDIAQFPDIRDSYARIKDAAASGWKTGVGDMALVFSFMRLLDPTSVVREGEYERARKTAGIPGWVWGMYQNVANGKFITPEQRADMVRLSQNSYKQKLERYRTARGWLNRLAKAYSVNPDLAIPDLELPGAQLMPEVDPTVPQPAAPDGTTLDEHGVPIPNGLFQPVGGVK